jgi:hypothetical protein
MFGHEKYRNSALLKTFLFLVWIPNSEERKLNPRKPYLRIIWLGQNVKLLSLGWHITILSDEPSHLECIRLSARQDIFRKPMKSEID